MTHELISGSKENVHKVENLVKRIISTDRGECSMLYRHSHDGLELKERIGDQIRVLSRPLDHM